MNISILSKKRGPGTGGATNSILSLARYLNQENKIQVLMNRDGLEEFNQIKDTNQFFTEKIPPPRELEMLYFYCEYCHRYLTDIESFEPDLIISQIDSIYLGHKLSRKLDIPHVIFLRDLTQRHNAFFRGSLLPTKIINYLTSFLNKRLVDKIYSEADIVVANSNFTKKKYREEFDIDIDVIYPFVDIEEYKVEEKGDKILHVNPYRHKGIETTLKIAKEMPEEEFIVAGTAEDQEIREKMQKTENVQHLGYVEDMREAYRQTKIVLMPSKWGEPFGRIPIEAGASGIPTIATNKAGLPESVGNKELLVDSEKPKDFVRKIKETKENYEELSELVAENSEKKSEEVQFQKLSELNCDGLV